MTAIKKYHFWALYWLFLVIFYITSMQYGFSEKSWDSIICFIQLAFDSCIIFLAYLTWKNKKDNVTRQFYFLIFLSLFPGIFSNEIYNVLNIIGIKVINNDINNFWAITYSVFLIIEIMAWFYLYWQKGKENNRAWSTTFSYLRLATIVVLSFLSIVSIRSTLLVEIGITGVINLLLEIALFIAISLVLTRTKSQSLTYLTAGFLLLIAFNLAHRFNYNTGDYFRTFEMVWLISPVTIAFGFFKAWRDTKSIEFFRNDSLHVYASSVFLDFSTLLLVAFIIIDVILSSATMNKIVYSDVLPQNIPSILIFSYTLALLVSKLVAGYLSNPLEKISKRIDFAYENKLNSVELLNEQFKINEFDNLDKFILKTITELQAANRVKSDFLMQMSHDFRTPASGISCLSRSIYKKMADPELKNLQKLIVNSSEQLMCFLDDVLDYSRLDSDRFKLEVSQFNIIKLIKIIVLFVSAKAKEKNLYVETFFEDSPLDYDYVGDRHMLHRVILNVISNAIKFTLQGGVTISSYRVKTNNASSLVIEIKDTGIGIDKKYHDFIFEPFNRIESSDGNKNPGIGLGLSNVKLMLKKMGGEIRLQSEVGQGSTFFIVIPDEKPA